VKNKNLKIKMVYPIQAVTYAVPKCTFIQMSAEY